MLQLVALFSKVRDEWIAEDLNGWLAPNRIYEGVAAPVKQSMGSNEVYVVTTKGVRCGPEGREDAEREWCDESDAYVKGGAI